MWRGEGNIRARGRILHWKRGSKIICSMILRLLGRIWSREEGEESEILEKKIKIFFFKWGWERILSCRELYTPPSDDMSLLSTAFLARRYLSWSELWVAPFSVYPLTDQLHHWFITYYMSTSIFKISRQIELLILVDYNLYCIHVHVLLCKKRV